MADVSNVRFEEIKNIYESLEALSCTSTVLHDVRDYNTNTRTTSTCGDKGALLKVPLSTHTISYRCIRTAPTAALTGAQA